MNNSTVTELDYALNCAAVEIDTTNARAELLQLRAAAAERDRLQAEVDALAAENDAIHRAINKMCGTDTSTIEAVQHVIEERDRLQAELQASQEEVASMSGEIGAQAAQLEQAQNDGAEWMRKCVMDMLREKSIEFFKEYERKHGDTSSADLNASNCVSAMRDIVSYLPTWLAANAPAPEAEPVSAFEAIDKLMTERGDLFNAAPGTEATK